MIIKDRKYPDLFVETKTRVYQVVKAINSNFSTDSSSLVYILILYVIVSLPYISILFKHTNHFPQQISQVLRLILCSQAAPVIGLEPVISDMLIILWSLLIIILTTLNFLMDSVPSQITFLLGIWTKMSCILIVSFTDYAVECYLRFQNPAQQLISKITGSVVITLVAITTCLIIVLTFFEIRILRRKTIFWNFQGKIYAYGLMYQIYKTVVISLGQPQLTWCSIGLIVWFYQKQFQVLSGANENKLGSTTGDIIAATDLAVIVSILTSEPTVALGLWIVLLIAIFTYMGMTINNIKQSEVYLPICSNKPETFYDFYYRYNNTSKQDQNNWQEQKEKILHIHSVYCSKQQCTLNQYMDEDNVQSLEDLISGIIKAKKDENVHNRIVFELWNLELGKGVDVSGLMRKRGITWSQDYIIFCIDEMSRDSEVTLQTSEDSRQAIVKAFYDLMAELADHYACFYDELTQNSPVTDILVNNGVAVMEKMEKLKAVYEQLLKLKLLNFRMAELYIDFVKSFVGLDFLDRDDAERLTSLQKNVEFEDISENPMPTFTVFPESGTIEDANAEAQKFFAMTRFQLKGKKVQDLLYPEVNNQFLKEGFKSDKIKKGGSFCSFFRKGQGLNACGSLRISKQAFKQKQLIVVEITPEPFSVLRNVFLVTSDFKMELSYKESTKLKDGCYRHQPMKVSWAHMFEEYIGPNRQKLEKSTMVKIPTSLRECSIVVKERKCLTEDFHILECQMFLSKHSAMSRITDRNKQSSPIQRKILSLSRNTEMKTEQFAFNYIQNNDISKAILYGGIPESTEVRALQSQKTLNPFEKSLNSKLVANFLDQSNDYAEDIKTYRLYQGELYNVDLQDKEAYYDQFEPHVFAQNVKGQDSYSSFEKYFTMGVLMFGAILLSLAVYSIIRFSNDTDQIFNLFSRHFGIHYMFLDFNRIMSLLKDEASGFSARFPSISIEQSVNSSYSRLNALKNSEIFTNTPYQIQFQGVVYQGTIIQLINLIISHITSIFVNKDLGLIEDIHQSYEILIGMMESAEEEFHHMADVTFQNLSQINQLSIYLSIIFVSALIFTMLVFCYLSINKVESYISPFLYIADNQSRQYRQNAEKIKNAVEMQRKKIDMDYNNVVSEVRPQKKRKIAKKVRIKRQFVVSTIVLCLLGLGIHCICLFIFTSNYKSQLSMIKQMGQHNEAIFQAYNGGLELAIKVAHQGIVVQAEMASIKQNLAYIAYNLSHFAFSPSLNSILKTLHFENSCQLMKQWYNMTQQECHSMMPQFSISNPFEQGLIYYYNRQLYYFQNNITETFGYTSIYSNKFTDIYHYLVTQIEAQIHNSINNIKFMTQATTYIVIVLDILYLVMFGFIYFYFKRKYANIHRLNEFFKKLTFNEKKEKDEDSDEQINTSLIEEDEEHRAMLATKKPLKKRHSIEQRVKFKSTDDI